MSSLDIIIVTFNSADVIEPCLAALKQQDYFDYQVWVVDNASHDETVSKVLSLLPGDQVWRLSENIGFAGGNNYALARTRARFVLLVNPDCFLAPNYVSEMVKLMAADAALASATGLIYRDEARTRLDTTGLILRPWHAVGERRVALSGQVWGVSGACAFYRRSALEQVAPPLCFDERFFSYKEDVDLAYRLRQAGFKAWCTQESWAVHWRGVGGDKPRSQRSFQMRLCSYRNHVWLLAKNVKPLTWLTLGWLIIGYELIKAGYLLVSEPRVLITAWRDIINVKMRNPKSKFQNP